MLVDAMVSRKTGYKEAEKEVTVEVSDKFEAAVERARKARFEGNGK